MHTKRNRFVVANWKLHPETPKEALALFSATQKAVGSMAGISRVRLVVCPPALFLSDLARRRGVSRRLLLGAQDVFFETEGAHTGETSARTVQALKASYTLVGHSERRALGETDTLVAKKVACALRAGLTAIVCIGEEERNEDGAYYGLLRAQLEAVLRGLSRADLTHLIVAYEPVWAIGKGASGAMTPDALCETALFIRKVLIETFEKEAGGAVPVLYGGAVKGENARVLFEEGGVDGFLVGSASLQAKEFGEIVRAML